MRSRRRSRLFGHRRLGGGPVIAVSHLRRRTRSRGLTVFSGRSGGRPLH